LVSANAPGEELSIQNESLKISATDDGAFRLLTGSTNKQIADGKLEDVRGAAKRESVDSKTFGKGEAIVSYIQSAGGFSEPAPCYKCKGSGRAVVGRGKET